MKKYLIVVFIVFWAQSINSQSIYLDSKRSAIAPYAGIVLSEVSNTAKVLGIGLSIKKKIDLSFEYGLGKIRYDDGASSSGNYDYEIIGAVFSIWGKEEKDAFPLNGAFSFLFSETIFRNSGPSLTSVGLGFNVAYRYQNESIFIPQLSTYFIPYSENEGDVFRNNYEIESYFLFQLKTGTAFKIGTSNKIVFEPSITTTDRFDFSAGFSLAFIF